MYCCSICDAVVGPRVKQRKHVIRRRDGSALRELPVCYRCAEQLEFTPLSVLAGSHARPVRFATPPAITKPKPVGKPVPLSEIRVLPNGRLGVGTRKEEQVRGREQGKLPEGNGPGRG